MILVVCPSLLSTADKHLQNQLREEGYTCLDHSGSLREAGGGDGGGVGERDRGQGEG